MPMGVVVARVARTVVPDGSCLGQAAGTAGSPLAARPPLAGEGGGRASFMGRGGAAKGEA